MLRSTFVAGLALGLALTVEHPALGYPVGPSLGLDKLVEEADVIVKAVAVAAGPVEDAWFEPVHGFQPQSTELRIVAVYKGDIAAERIAFRHYAPADNPMAMMYMPQYYRFEPERSYIVFAKATDAAGVFRQLWKNHRIQEDQGVLRAAGEDPREGKSLAEVFWLELTDLAESDNADDVRYALEHLDVLSGGGYDGAHDLDREAVLAVVQPLIADPRPEIAAQAVTVLGCGNPYLRSDFAAGWLATIGGGHLPGYATWDREKTNPGGRRYWKELTALADSDKPAELRGLAIRALGLAGVPALLPHLQRWVRAPEPAVRQAAAVLAADFPQADGTLLQTLAADPEPMVRAGAAQAIGFGQFGDLVPTLDKLLDDASPEVVMSAAQSLLSFSLDKNGEVMRSRIGKSPYSPLFVNALARDNPEPYLEELRENVRRRQEPENWWGGWVPWGVSWEILFRHAQRQPAEKLTGGALDRTLDALESPATAPQPGAGYYSSSEPRDLYALYLQRGLRDRAARFRAACRKALPYDIDYYFKMVDENPSQYQR